MHQTLVLPFGSGAIDRAARLIAAGEAVAVATETVYGLAADATNEQAVARIYAAKGRPPYNPLIVHVHDLEAAERVGVFSDTARALASSHWPGPLTLVVPLRGDTDIAPAVTAGLHTVALRAPAHRAIQALLMATRLPLAAPSANASGRISPTTAAHVRRSLDGRIALIIDDGATSVGLESTVIAVRGTETRLLRSGAIIVDDLIVAPVFAGHPESPGQLDRHYAPAKPLRLNAADRREGEYLIGFGAIDGDTTLSATGDLTEAAAQLFACLHRADESPMRSIAVAPIPMRGTGQAINDRLRRAVA